MHLCYTGVQNEIPIIIFKKNVESIEHTIQNFDNIVTKIQVKEFGDSEKQQTCDNCDFK